MMNFFHRIFDRDVIDNARGRGVYISTRPVDIEHALVTAVESGNAKLNPREVEREQRPAVRGNEEAADASGIIIGPDHISAI
jgi:hypothetical protein